MWQVAVPLAFALGGGYLFLMRGKANIGDTVEFNHKIGGSFGEQRVILTGRVVKKSNPVVGPYYAIQIFKTPDLGPEFAAIAKMLPSTLEGITDAEIIRNLGKHATVV